jgi:hypothetical protein
MLSKDQIHHKECPQGHQPILSVHRITIDVTQEHTTAQADALIVKKLLTRAEEQRVVGMKQGRGWAHEVRRASAFGRCRSAQAPTAMRRCLPDPRLVTARTHLQRFRSGTLECKHNPQAALSRIATPGLEGAFQRE